MANYSGSLVVFKSLSWGAFVHTLCVVVNIPGGGLVTGLESRLGQHPFTD